MIECASVNEIINMYTFQILDFFLKIMQKLSKFHTFVCTFILLSPHSPPRITGRICNRYALVFVCTDEQNRIECIKLLKLPTYKISSYIHSTTLLEQ